MMRCENVSPAICLVKAKDHKDMFEISKSKMGTAEKLSNVFRFAQLFYPGGAPLLPKAARGARSLMEEEHTNVLQCVPQTGFSCAG